MLGLFWECVILGSIERVSDMHCAQWLLELRVSRHQCHSQPIWEQACWPIWMLATWCELCTLATMESMLRSACVHSAHLQCT